MQTKFRLNLLFVALLLLAVSYAECVAWQVQYDDLRAGYLENQASVQSEGIKVIFRYTETSSQDFHVLARQARIQYLESLISDPYVSSVEKTKFEKLLAGEQLPIEERYNFQNFSQSFLVAHCNSGTIIRIANSARNDVDDDKLKEWIPVYSQELTPYDHESGVFVTSYFKETDQDMVRIATATPRGKFFSIVRGSLPRAIRKNGTPLNSHPNFTQWRTNAPINFGFDNDLAIFCSPSTIVWGWQPEGVKHEIQKLDNGNYRVISREPIRKVRPVLEDKIGFVVTSEVDPDRGYLPVFVRIDQVSLLDGEVVGKGNVKTHFLDLEISELEGAGFYISKCVNTVMARRLVYPPSIKSGPFSKEVYLHFRNRPIDDETDLIEISQKTMRVDSIESWSIDDRSIFSPSSPQGVRFVDKISGEFKVDLEGQRSLELNLGAGAFPISKDFQADPIESNHRRQLVFWVCFWVLVCVIGCGVIFRARKLRMQGSNG